MLGSFPEKASSIVLKQVGRQEKNQIKSRSYILIVNNLTDEPIFLEKNLPGYMSLGRRELRRGSGARAKFFPMTKSPILMIGGIFWERRRLIKRLMAFLNKYLYFALGLNDKSLYITRGIFIWPLNC
ncbi:MAG: hypothetical protein LBT38_04900 [Deltaproteobacteria bacterium]|jgi:hypothetical protein|nr:hypothetical protein [Deltaproteobacteria bacterium]